ncbi:thiamine phosphate synthase [Chryseobacterium indoltheticum]|uniref:Regulatory protein tenI n=1 Tax=Chryseobacterium indoltheticum TaxID=254 RepID=A0A381F5V2_9FLAO|nr:thiamine phosphate synthase [Chryseobacterium indoltheticum]AZA72311.1 thiamine phosphate synthase [Chryseobacterium indoltheticum]SIR10144.1 thiamine-phosphate pyrophosphorylase [Chryseobacterium indoltheticum]SUX41873.1 Regulatory protein tenI [Chryseobacterium indoltheticum]
MIIVITPEEVVQNETEIINELFQEGLNLLHIRKPFINSEEMTDFIQKIDSKFHQKLVLHSHYDLAKDFNISRFNFREVDRQNGLFQSFTDKIISTSVHDIETFNLLSEDWEYAFISPVFPSISKKGYGENSNILNDIKKRDHQNVQLIALGGINENNIKEVFESEVDGVALLGAIWGNDEPLGVFKKCRQNVIY